MTVDDASTDDLTLDTGSLVHVGPKPLLGWKVLVPRGGVWGDRVAAALRLRGATPVVAPMINFAATDDTDTLMAALADLAAGAFDWVTVTSATTVEVLNSHGAVIPETTKIAAVGEATAAALTAAGYRADLVPKENSARGLLEEWTAATAGAVPLRILTLRSQIAKPLLTNGLIRIGHDVRSVVAYRTVGVSVPEKVSRDVAAGDMQAILITSGSVAQQVSEQFGTVPEGTIIAAIGPTTARDARNLGIAVDVVAYEQTTTSLIQTLVAKAGS